MRIGSKFSEVKATVVRKDTVGFNREEAAGDLASKVFSFHREHDRMIHQEFVEPAGCGKGLGRGHGAWLEALSLRHGLGRCGFLNLG